MGTLDHVVDQASRVAGQYGTDHLDQVARELGMEVYDLLEAEGLTEAYFPALRAVALQPGLPQHERRYLVAHALGHDLLHRDGPARDYLTLHRRAGNGDPALTRAESEADLFAACLLIPGERFQALLAQEWVHDAKDPALSLAIEFQVPVAAMRVRLVYERCLRLREQ